ncbi:hypothetical protein FHS18_005397 [Paenibacillus phyllosphaerae]|uniref:Uncharacterized protein n=1 Tax=Paenibacillus phyllosphaerae TaxID=274593 RepID=A0A7W5FQR1_9BACL|nr:hypothetical protein [Paenibacillus phyllosphaerae]MBB3113294.1 hypothetical protein [Paenibacillus phyllosphaerae]
MLEKLAGFVPSGSVFFCTILAGAIPFLIYQYNQRLHKNGDPPWKEKDQESP